MTFVLLHGGRLGGWCWRKVAPLLRAAGHEVCTPTLTGVGERSHLARPDTDLDTHIQDLVATIEYEDLHDVVLVGHSYGGLVITGAAEHVADRLAQLVYLDAIVPEAGQSAMDLSKPGNVTALLRAAETAGDGWLVPPPRSPQLLGVTADEDVRWLAPRLSHQPLLTYQQPLRSAQRAATLPRTFIRCTEGLVLAADAGDQFRASPEWRYYELATGHNPMFTAPEALAALLLQIAT